MFHPDRWEPLTLLLAYAGYILMMCFNKHLEKFFIAKLAFIPFLRVPKEWYDQEVEKRGLVPKEMRTTSETEFTGRDGEKAAKTESSGLVEGKRPSNGSLETTGPSDVGITPLSTSNITDIFSVFKILAFHYN